jgi:uncharacterized membrane protein YebE (DUF533 family)
MQISSLSLKAFEPAIYLQTLAALAAVDGESPDETAFLQRRATELGIDLNDALAAEPKPVAEMAAAASDTTRRLIYRDCFMLAHADGVVSEQERAMLDSLQRDLRIAPETAFAIEAWTARLSNLLVEADGLFGS